MENDTGASSGLQEASGDALAVKYPQGPFLNTPGKSPRTKIRSRPLFYLLLFMKMSLGPFGTLDVPLEAPRDNKKDNEDA